MEPIVSKPFLLQDQTVHPAQIELPEELREKVVILECESVKGICNVYLVGTCHVSSQSSKDVEAIIGFLKPDVVFLELCESRAYMMYPVPPQIIEELRFTDFMVAMWETSYCNAFDILASLVLGMFGKKLQVFPGSEFQSAYKEAKKYGGEVILGDRPAEITCQRTRSMMSFWYKTKFVFSSLLLLPIAPFLSVDVDAITGNNELMEREFPSMAETQIHERDLYMAKGLFEVAKECKSVVAVVGKCHVAGIQKNWKKPIAIESLMEVNAATSTSAVKLWTTVALAAVGVAFFFVLWFKH